MTKINNQILKNEFNKWLKSTKNVKKSNVDDQITFGKLMADKYNIKDEALKNEIDPNMALLRLMSKYVQREESKI
tara:strand:- start:2531 stop:2755 length:225 start_codon:yes stop_codon:yes gene_type:complete